MPLTCRKHAQIAALLGLILITPPTPAMGAETASTPPSPWAPLQFLMGTWTGAGSGQPGESSVRREYRGVLRNKFIETRNQSTYAPQPKNPKGEVHEDRGMISWDRARRRYVLRQFHVEGFVNQYVADSLTASADSIVFRSESIENIPPGFRARETYRRLGPDTFVERFEMAEPGGDFSTYSETRFTRDASPGSSEP